MQSRQTARVGADATFVYAADDATEILDGLSALSDHAAANARTLAGEGLHEFIATQLASDQHGSLPHCWLNFHESITLVYNYVPMLYFSPMKELADIAVTLGRRGARLSETVDVASDASWRWSQHWEEEAFDARFGKRSRYLNTYPAYVPQGARPFPTPYCYPMSSLQAFRAWCFSDNAIDAMVDDMRVASSGRLSSSVAELVTMLPGERSEALWHREPGASG